MDGLFRSVSTRTRVLVFAALSLLAALLSWQETRLGAVLKTPDAPCGIVSLELAWTPQRAHGVLRDWSRSAADAGLQIAWDFPFLMAYPLWFAWGTLLIGRAPLNRRPRLAPRLARWVLLAAPLDCLENLGMLWMLAREPTWTVTLVTSLCAALKFLLLVACTVYALTCWLGRRRSSTVP